jgi:hypothetical protein
MARGQSKGQGRIAKCLEAYEDALSEVIDANRRPRRLDAENWFELAHSPRLNPGFTDGCLSRRRKPEKDLRYEFARTSERVPCSAHVDELEDDRRTLIGGIDEPHADDLRRCEFHVSSLALDRSSNRNCCATVSRIEGPRLGHPAPSLYSTCFLGRPNDDGLPGVLAVANEDRLMKFLSIAE